VTLNPNSEAIGTSENSITPKRLSRFGIEVDEALRVGGSGFLGESVDGEEDEGSVLEIFYNLMIMLKKS